jgi:hypothetical protein
MANSSTSNQGSASTPIIVAIEMGYGHLRAANTIAESLGTHVVRMDLPPVASPGEAALWRGMRKFYNGLSQVCDWPMGGAAASVILEKITKITPLRTDTRGEPPTVLARLADSLTRCTFGRGLRAMAAGKQLIATYPAIAMAARHASGTRVFCLATDTDLNRAWAPANAANAAIDYFAPVKRVAERLRSFGVPEKRIHLTGFPLPEKLIEQTKTSLARRMYRLDPTHNFREQASSEISEIAEFTRDRQQPSRMEPISLTVALGGAGSQVRQVSQILRSVRDRILAGKLRLTLVAGTRADAAQTLRKMIQQSGLSSDDPSTVTVLFAADANDYFRLFEACLENTDLLWTKPGELVFYAALGLPLLLAPPLGDQEHSNRHWLLSNDAAVDAGSPASLDQRLEALLGTGELCRIAWNAYSRLDRNGTRRIREALASAG